MLMILLNKLVDSFLSVLSGETLELDIFIETDEMLNYYIAILSKNII